MDFERYRVRDLAVHRDVGREAKQAAVSEAGAWHPESQVKEISWEMRVENFVSYGTWLAGKWY